MKTNKIDSDKIIDEVLHLTKKRSLVIYGAGNYGNLFGKYLIKQHHFDDFIYAVSDGEKINSFPNEKSVQYISQVPSDSVVIICVSEQRQHTLIEILDKLGFGESFVILNEFIRFIQAQLNESRMEVRKKLSFEVHITEHCNLNCKGCYHFSPLSDEEYLSIEEYTNDLKRIRSLFGNNVDRITLLGGEPLLHPEICEIIKCTKRTLPETNLEILTNGILLLKMPEGFWNVCRDNNISMNCTKYPINVDYDGIEKKAKGYGLSIDYHNDVGAGEKTLIKYPFDLSGKNDPESNYQICTRSNLCITLKHGRLYTCPMAAHAHLAKKYYDLNIELSEENSINIYEAQSAEEVMSFFTKPIPFCKYCNFERRPEQMRWEVSKKEFNEWF